MGGNHHPPPAWSSNLPGRTNARGRTRAEGCDWSDDAWSICNTACQKSRNRTLVEGENCGENDDGVLLETVACEDGNCTKDTPASSPKIETVPFTLFLGLLFFAFAK